MTERRLRGALSNFMEKVEADKIEYGLLGILADGVPLYDVPGRDGYMYVRIIKGQETVSQTIALNAVTGRIYNLYVKMRRLPSGTLEVIGQSTEFNVAMLGSRPTGAVGVHSHELGFGYEDFVSSRRIKSGLVTVSTGMVVEVRPFLYEYRGLPLLCEGGTIDLTAYRPATAGTTAWVYVGWDPSSLAIVAATGTEIYGVPTPDPEWSDDMISATLGDDVIPLAVTRLSSSQTVINDEGLFRDGRLFLGRKLDTVKADLVARDAATITLATGVATVTRGNHVLVAESGTSDDLATLSGIEAGYFYMLRADTGDSITLKHGAGNIFLSALADVTLNGMKTILLFSPDGTNVVDVSAGDEYVRVVSKSGDYTATSGDRVIRFTSNATLTLPVATGSGRKFTVIADGATVIVDGNGSDTINGELTQTIYDDEAVVLYDTAAGIWNIG